MLLLALSGVFLLRFDARQFLALLFQAPPRRTRRYGPTPTHSIATSPRVARWKMQSISLVPTVLRGNDIFDAPRLGLGVYDTVCPRQPFASSQNVATRCYYLSCRITGGVAGVESSKPRQASQGFEDSTPATQTSSTLRVLAWTERAGHGESPEVVHSESAHPAERGKRIPTEDRGNQEMREKYNEFRLNNNFLFATRFARKGIHRKSNAKS